MQDRAEDRAAIAAAEQVEGVRCAGSLAPEERGSASAPVLRAGTAPGRGNLGPLELDRSCSPGLEGGTGREVREWVPRGGRVSFGS